MRPRHFVETKISIEEVIAEMQNKKSFVAQHEDNNRKNRFRK